MNRFGQQEKSDGTRRLRSLLAQVKTPARQEADWHRLENDLFAALDGEKRDSRQSFRLVVPGLFLRGAAYSVAALLLLFLAGIGMKTMLEKPRSNSSCAALISVHGKVAVKWAGAGGWDTLSSLDPLEARKTAEPGTIIAPLDNSSAIMLLDKGSVIALYEKSLFTIRASNGKRQAFVLATGSLLAKVNKRETGQVFEVSTPCARCTIVGTIFGIDAGASEKTTLSVYHGKVKMEPLTGSVSIPTLVATGRQMTVSRGGAVAFGIISEGETPIRDISVLSMLVEHAENSTDTCAVLDITSKPDGAKVMIHNSFAGTTPLLLKTSPGVYPVSLYYDGYDRYESTMTVGSDRVVRLSADLSHKSILSAPSPAPRRHREPSASARRKQSEEELRLIPEYIEALVNISSGEYQQALSLLDSLSGCGMVDIKQRMCIMETINSCYRKLGDFQHAADVLEERLAKADSPQSKSQILWEMANVRANCLGDYEGAEMALVEFLILEPDAMWAHNAYSKLAEVQYYLGKFSVAAATYRKHIATFPDDPDIDRSMYNLACILGSDLDDCVKAVDWYSRVIRSYPASSYRPAALFRRAECLSQMGKTDEAIKDYQAYLSLNPDGAWRSLCMGALKKARK